MSTTGTTFSIDKPHLTVKGGEVRTTSLAVALHFDKQHKHVMRDIRNLEKLRPDWVRSNFGPVKESMSYMNSSGVMAQKETTRTGHYTISSKGFQILAMGFTGEKALDWKIRYADAFEAMATLLSQGETRQMQHQIDDARRQADEAIAQVWSEAKAYVQESQDTLVEVFQEVVQEQKEQAWAEAARLTATQLGHKLGLPNFGKPSWAGGMVSEEFTLVFFTLDRNFADATIMWLLYEYYDANREVVKINASDLLEKGNGAFCRSTLYNSRRRMIAAGLLQHLPNEQWHINMDALRARLNETQLVANAHRVPLVEPKEFGINGRIQKWLASLPARPTKPTLSQISAGAALADAHAIH